MSLKVVTSALVLLGLALFGILLVVLATKPAEQAHAARVFAVQAGILFVSTLIVWFLAAASAYMVFRQAREEMAEQSEQNMRELIEGTLRDHERKPEGELADQPRSDGEGH